MNELKLPRLCALNIQSRLDTKSTSRVSNTKTIRLCTSILGGTNLGIPSQYIKQQLGAYKFWLPLTSLKDSGGNWA